MNCFIHPADLFIDSYGKNILGFNIFFYKMSKTTLKEPRQSLEANVIKEPRQSLLKTTVHRYCFILAIKKYYYDINNQVFCMFYFERVFIIHKIIKP
jgi:hypothetical protein